jgi:hypothetical protein
MIMINRDYQPEDELMVLHLDIKEMTMVWSALEFLTTVQDPEDRPESEREALRLKLVPFFRLKEKVKKHLNACAEGGGVE